MERYIPDKCTHIICASNKTLHPSLFYKLQVTSVDEVPEHIPILNWKFVSKCITKYNEEEGPIIKARQEKADLEWRGLKRKNPAPELVPLEDRPQGFFLPPQEEWPKYSACPWRGTGAAQAVGGESRQRASSYASSEASESGYSSPSRATSEAASGAEDAPEGRVDDREVDPLVPFYDQAKDDRAKEYEEEHGFPPPDVSLRFFISLHSRPGFRSPLLLRPPVLLHPLGISDHEHRSCGTSSQTRTTMRT